jgi:hypothetical protein
MAKEGFKRKLAAILCTDLEGYCRFMRQNEEATIHICSFTVSLSID